MTTRTITIVEHGARIDDATLSSGPNVITLVQDPHESPRRFTQRMLRRLAAAYREGALEEVRYVCANSKSRVTLDRRGRVALPLLRALAELNGVTLVVWSPPRMSPFDVLTSVDSLLSRLRSLPGLLLQFRFPVPDLTLSGAAVAS